MNVRHFLADVWTVFLKDLLELKRKPMMLAGMALSPLALLALFGFVFPNMTAPTDIPFGLASVDDPTNGESEADAFIGKLLVVNDRFDLFEFTRYESEEAARKAVESKDVRGFILIPPEFTDARRHGGYAAPVHVYYDVSNPSLGRLVASQAQLLVRLVSQEEGEANVRAVTHLGSDEATDAFMSPYATEARTLTPAPDSYFQFLVPGLIMLATLSAVILGLPRALARERDWGTLDAVLASAVTRQGFLVGKLVANGARGLVQATITTTLGVLVFGVSLGGRPHLVLVLTLLALLSFSGIGLALATFFKPDQDSARGYRLAVFLPMLLLSGVFFPIEQLPTFIQPVSKILPLTYAVAALRRVMITGADLSGVAFEVSVLVGLTIVGFALAAPLLKRYSTTV